MIRLIASDIDGTLLPHGQREISDEMFYLIQRLHDAGIRFVPASGRQYPSMRRLFAPVAELLTYVCENGSLVMEGSDLLFQSVIDRQTGLALIADIEAQPGLEVLLNCQQSCYISPRDADYVHHIRDVLCNHTHTVNEFTRVQEPFLKISAWCTGGVTPALVDYFKSRWGETMNVAVAGEKWIDITLSDKGSAVAHIAQKHGIKPEEVMAFGDNFNDIKMLQYARHSYAMATADPVVLANAAHQCNRVEDVVAALLQQ